MQDFNSLIQLKKNVHGSKFSEESINRSFIKYYNNQKRVEVSFCNSDGKRFEVKRGRIGITTGHVPCFLLLLTKRSISSTYTIGKNDRVIKIIGD